MKKENALKFTLTIAASVLLAACGSSGGNSAPAQPVQPTAEELAAQKAKELKEQLAAEAKETQVLGGKVVSKTKSDFIVEGRTPAKNSEAGLSSQITVENPVPSFDTLVIAAPKIQGSYNIAYVEDFRTEASLAEGATAAVNGVTKFTKVYVSPAEGGKSTTLVEGAQERTAAGEDRANGLTDEYGNITKTAKQGTEDAKVYVYGNADNSKVYFPLEGKSAGRLYQGQDDDSVAEIYGRTTTSRDNVKDSAEVKEKNRAINLPLEDAHLELVQYGRVTTALDSEKLVDSSLEKTFKDGVKLGGNLKTYVTPYAKFNTKDSKEDHYFFRGIDVVTPAKLVEYGFNDAKGGSVTYKGHAVTYGLENAYHGNNKSAVKDAPTALAGVKDAEAPKAVSGTHVTAVVDLTNRNVTGSLYNKFNVNGKDVDDTLVTFKGDLKANGNAVGTSELVYVPADAANKQGTFAATLFGNGGKAATELGGTVVSKEGAENQKWGAVFGAKAVLDPVVEPVVLNPLSQTENAKQEPGSNPKQ